MKPGVIYVLVHPSDPDPYKIGRTTQKLEKRIAKAKAKAASPR